jgi:hypothetical protein
MTLLDELLDRVRGDAPVRPVALGRGASYREIPGVRRIALAAPGTVL